jgi:hypothetical protein
MCCTLIQGGERGASDKVNKHPFYVDGLTLETEFGSSFCFCWFACAPASLVSIVHHAMRGYSALHMKDAVLNRPPTTHRFGRAKGVMEAGRSVMVDKRGGI